MKDNMNKQGISDLKIENDERMKEGELWRI